MSGTTSTAATTKSSFLLTPVMRGSFLNLFAPRLMKQAKPGDRARYSLTGLVLAPENMESAWSGRPKADADLDRERWSALQAAVVKCGKESELGPDKFLLYVKDHKVKLPIRTDVESSGFPGEYKYFIRAWSYMQPGIVSAYFETNPDGSPKVDPKTGRKIPRQITDPNKAYSGVWLRASVKPFYTNYEKTNPSIAFQLGNVQIVRDGDRLDGKMAAQDEFDATDEAPAGMDFAGSAGQVGGDAAELAALLGSS